MSTSDLTQNGLRGLRVLVVEDESAVAMLVEDMLADLGCVVTASAAIVSKALDLVDRGGFDFALLDVNVNGEEAYPVAERLIQRGMPFAFATGYGEVGMREDFRLVPTIQKPFRLAELEAAIKRATRL